MARSPTNEAEIRPLLRRSIRREFGKETALLDEFPIPVDGTRIDLLAVNGRLEGFEIKSGCDDLSRLAQQVTSFARATERLAIVVDRRHLAKASASVPRWCGIYVVDRSRTSLRLMCLRSSKRSPTLDHGALVRFLHNRELVAALQMAGIANPAQMTRDWMCDEVVARLSVGKIRRLVRSALKSRRAGRMARTN
jgi:hypothetical protein